MQENNVPIVQEDQTASQDRAQANTDASGREEDVSNPAVFVNTRRGKRNCTKRKICDAATEDDASSPLSAAEVVTAHRDMLNFLYIYIYMYKFILQQRQ